MAEAAHGPVEVLVANAGTTRDQLLALMSEDDFAAVLDTNLTGAYRVAKRAVLGMIRMRRGRMVFISSVAGPRAGQPVHHRQRTISEPAQTRNCHITRSSTMTDQTDSPVRPDRSRSTLAARPPAATLGPEGASGRAAGAGLGLEDPRRRPGRQRHPRAGVSRHRLAAGRKSSPRLRQSSPWPCAVRQGQPDRRSTSSSPRAVRPTHTLSPDFSRAIRPGRGQLVKVVGRGGGRAVHGCG